MRRGAVKPGEWGVLWSVTGAVLLVLLWAASKPTVCAASFEACASASARVMPSATGALVVVGIAVAVSLVASRSAGRVVEGVRRSEGVIAVGTAVVAVVGVAFVLATLFSAGFALTL